MDKEKYRSKTVNKESKTERKIPYKKKLHGLAKITNKPITFISQKKKEEIKKRMDNVVKKRKFILEIDKNVISFKFLPSLEKKIKEREKELKKLKLMQLLEKTLIEMFLRLIIYQLKQKVN